jgi:D-alanyl-D-alanine carboxypeptidase
MDEAAIHTVNSLCYRRQSRYARRLMASARLVRLCFALGLLMGLPMCVRPTQSSATVSSASGTKEQRGTADAATLSSGERSLGNRLDEVLGLTVRGLGVAGATVAVVLHGRPVLVQGYGLADVLGNVPMRADHIFRIGSITKSFTAAAILKLEALGKLQLADPLTKHLPDYTVGSAVTLQHLLTHTSGIPDYVELPGFGERMAEAKTRAELVAAFAQLPLQFTPGSEFSYSNSGYYLLGLVIERISGQSYTDFLQAELFAPAGLGDTCYCPDAQDYPRAALGYESSSGTLAPAKPAMMTLTFSAGALCSTASDLVRWIAALSHGKVITPLAFARMSQPTLLTSGNIHPYGLGLAPRELEGHSRVGHYGDINGFGSALHYYPLDELYIAVLVNTEGKAAPDIAEKIARTVFSSKQPLQ